MSRAPSPLVGLLLLVGAGCGGDPELLPPDVLVESSPDRRHNVLVIDDGFDREAYVFRGRLAGVYSISCAQGGAQVLADDGGVAPGDGGVDGGDGGVDGGDGGVGANLAERKAALIASLRTRLIDCRLTPGVSPKPDPLAPIAHLRARWNDVIRNSRFAGDVFRPAELDQIREAQKALGKARFHGTATAGLLAHDNPRLRLVLIEELLGTVESIAENFSCFKQQDIDDNVTLFTDPEVRQAYVARPLSALDDDFREVHARHRVGVVNESFGQLSRQALEALQASKGCAPVDLRRYFGVLGELDATRARARPDPDGLLVKSAGNDESRIDGTEDHPMCAAPGTPRLIVGAYDNAGKMADFTNFGGCVDVLAPGWRIVTPIPGGWLMPLSGTSFSAPLVARLVSLHALPEPYDPAGARAQVLAMRDAHDRIPLQRFPREVLYDPERAANSWALTLGRPAAAVPLVNVRRLREFQALLPRR